MLYLFPLQRLILNKTSDDLAPPSWRDVHPIVTLSYLLLAVLHYIAGSSGRDCNFVLRLLRQIIELAYLSQGTIMAEERQVLNSLPRNVEKVFEKFDVESDTVAYVCCPRCFQCYIFDPDLPTSYPERCTNRSAPGSDPCNRILRRARTVKGVEHSLPSRKFIYHDMKKWVGRLISRPGMEDVLDRKYTP